MSIKVYGIETEDFKYATKEEILAYFKEKEEIQYDCETTGFRPVNDDIICFQMGDYDNQFVIHPSKLMEFKPALERRRLIGHNIKFDLGFLYKYNIWPNEVYDTYLAEGVIHCGIKTERKGLAHIAHKRLGIDLDKSVRDNIWQEGLTKRVIEYAAEDVKWLQRLKDEQKQDLDRLELHDALELDNQFVLTLAYIEYCGFKLDGEKWFKKHIKDVESFKEKEKILDEYIIYNEMEKWIDRQMDLFSDELKTTINWKSPKQVIALFQELKIPVEIIKKGEKKLTVDSRHLTKYRKKFDIIPKYIEYKEAEKVVGTYGNSFIEQIHPKTGRLYTNFKQIMDTGRLSSGGKNKETKEEYINFQNIPKEKETRECFIPEKGNIFIIGDYGSQESVVLTNVSMEEKLIAFFETGGGDMHAFVASKMYKELEDKSFEEIKENHAEQRYAAKTAGFAINYGGVGETIAANSEDGLSVEEGQAIYDAYMEAFPGLRAYFNRAKMEGLRNGFILMSPITKRKSFIYGYQDYLELKDKFTRKFWDRWKWLKNYAKDGDEYNAAKLQISKFFKIKGEIERKSLNYPIQGQSAEISKIAGVEFFKWIKENKYQNIVLMVNVIHDEFVIECPKKMGKDVAAQLKYFMLESGKPYCKRISLGAEVKLAANWGEK